MSRKAPDSGPVGNTDPGKRGRRLPRQDRDPTPGGPVPPRRPRGEAPGYGEVTRKPGDN